MSDVFSFIGFVVELVFFIWFGLTMNSINRRLGEIAEDSSRQTALLASITKAAKPPEVADQTPKKPCVSCRNPIPIAAKYCVYCGKAA
jgi:hypothetical protein